MSTMTVTAPGMLTTVQDWPGRTGYWQVGVPPSGPMDDLSFRLGNKAVGNPEGAAGLEATLAGPTLRFAEDTLVCVTGAPAPVTLNGTPVPQWRAITVPAGGTLSVGAAADTGMRIYVLIAGGIEVLHERLVASGVDSTLQIWPDQFHVFQAFHPLIPEAVRAVRNLGKFMRTSTD